MNYVNIRYTNRRQKTFGQVTSARPSRQVAASALGARRERDTRRGASVDYQCGPCAICPCCSGLLHLALSDGRRGGSVTGKRGGSVSDEEYSSTASSTHNTARVSNVCQGCMNLVQILSVGSDANG